MLPRSRSSRAVLAGVVGVVVVTAALLLPGTATVPMSADDLGPGRTASPVGSADPGVASAERRRKPNIVVVMADDMRVDELRFMPSLRASVVEHGLTFQNSFSPYPLCCPSRASFLTGQYAHNHRVFSHEDPYGYGAFDDSRTLATSLRDAGYTTGFVGKYLNRYGPARSLVSGRPSFRYVPRGWTDWRASIDPGVPSVRGNTYDYMDTPFNVNGRVDESHRGKYSSFVIGSFSVEMARSFSRRAQPFFLYVNYVAPHFGGPTEPDDPPRFLTDTRGRPQDVRTPARPRSVRGRFDGLIDRAAGLPRGGGPSERDISDKPRSFRIQPELSPRERAAVRTMTRQRAEAVYVMDQQIGRLVQELKRSGEWRDTVFMFTSDNGYFLGEHRRRSGKVRAHEPSLRVPFVVTGPGMRREAERFDPITTIDVSATILDLGNARPPRRADGTSRLTTMRRGDRGWVTPVVDEATGTEGRGVRSPGFSGPRTSIGVRTARYSYIRNRTGEHELYDLVRDPLQLQNVHGRRAYRAVEQDLYRTWWRARSCAGDTCRVPLPASLRATPRQSATMTRAYWRKVTRVYGF
ncbi:sulfatase [Nocardioides sp.]|uniref:sulfatase family protein n=1 Tax=Nocardioides sp. TaxID=35761 RepID=UPI00286C42E7|nr:sulfatase [Nocardioides sp.]